MPSLLALDTTTARCSVALYHQGSAYTRSEVGPLKHTQTILPMIEALLWEAGLTLSAIQALAVTRGPGTFTGVRTGVALVQGLALGLDLPLIALTSLEVLAQQAWRLRGSTQVLTAIDARQGECYWAGYRRQEEVWLLAIAPCIGKPSELPWPAETQEWDFIGVQVQADLARKSAQLCGSAVSEVSYPEAADLLTLALCHYAQGRCMPLEALEPLYLREKVT